MSEAVRAVAWFRDGRWWAAGEHADGTHTPPADLGLTTVGAASATQRTAEVFGVPPTAVVLVAASFAPDRGDPAEAATASAYGLRSEATAGEEWCNHDPAAVRCECGVLVRVEALAEAFEQWDDGGPMQETLDAVCQLAERLGGPPVTDDERAAVVARIGG